MYVMKFTEEHAGKWVATRNHKVIDSSKSLNSLMKKVEKRKDHAKVRFALVPKGCLAGFLYGF